MEGEGRWKSEACLSIFPPPRPMDAFRVNNSILTGGGRTGTQEKRLLQVRQGPLHAFRRTLLCDSFIHCADNGSQAAYTTAKPQQSTHTHRRQRNHGKRQQKQQIKPARPAYEHPDGVFITRTGRPLGQRWSCPFGGSSAPRWHAGGAEGGGAKVPGAASGLQR